MKKTKIYFEQINIGRRLYVFLVVFGVLGLVALLVTNAATYSISVEPEESAPNNFVINDQTASGTKAVQFGSAIQTGAVWKPAQQTRWQWVLSGKADTSELSRFDMYDIDLTDAIPSNMTQQVTWANGYTTTVTWPKGSNAGIIASLKASGKKVVCYMDTGAFEDYEPDASLFPGKWGTNNNIRTVGYNGPPEYQNIDVLGGDSEDSSGGTFNGEYWLDIREASWKYFAPIMWARLDLAKSIGCDGVEGDQNNSYGNDTTFGVNEQISLRWYREFFYQTHQRGMAAIAKNGVEIAEEMLVDPSNVSYCKNGSCQADGFLNEECKQYNECEVYNIALSKGLWVGQVEYKGVATAICPDANVKKRMAMRKPQYDPVDMKISFACWEQ